MSITDDAPAQTKDADSHPDESPDQGAEEAEASAQSSPQAPEAEETTELPPQILPSAIESHQTQEAPNSDDTPGEPLPLRNGVHTSGESAINTAESRHHHHSSERDEKADSETAARLEAMAKERDQLREEVAELRQSLENIQGKHQEELSGLREEIEDAQSAKENAESQYRTLLAKVNTIRSQLGERLKADAVHEPRSRHLEPRMLSRYRKSYRKPAPKSKSCRRRSAVHSRRIRVCNPP